MDEEIRVLGYCAECGFEITDEIGEYYCCDDDGDLFCCESCVAEHFEIYKVEV